jgi:single-strand DNA-binding protein
MTDINRIVLTGNLGQEPEFKYFESGSMMTTFSMGVKRYDSKKKEDITDWYNVKTFSKLGEYLKKGIKVAVDGVLQTDTWEKDGEKKKAIYVMADSIQILTPKE